MSQAVYLKTPADYIACDGLEFAWSIDDVMLVRRLWEEGVSGWDISETLGRDPDEVAVLLIGLAREDDEAMAITHRPGGWQGTRRSSMVQRKGP